MGLAAVPSLIPSRCARPLQMAFTITACIILLLVGVAAIVFLFVFLFDRLILGPRRVEVADPAVCTTAQAVWSLARAVIAMIW